MIIALRKPRNTGKKIRHVGKQKIHSNTADWSAVYQLFCQSGMDTNNENQSLRMDKTTAGVYY